jgi:hypothetical protein
LKSTGGTPSELVRALNALGRDRDAERLARVAEKLSANIAASGTPATNGLGSSIGTKLVVSALGLGALGLLGYALTQRAAPAPEAPPAPPVAASAPDAPAPAPAARGSEAVDAVEPQTQTPAPGLGRPTATPPSRRSPVRARAGLPAATNDSRAAPAASTAPESSQTAAAAGSEPANAAEQAPPSAPEPEVRAEEPARDAEKAPAQPSPTPPARRSEVSLLHQARKAAAREPESALQLLDEHARRFPSGLLVPEREVLAIEVLRRLGRDAEAERRLRRFEARYPGSIHLRRLERGAAGEGG